MIILKQILIRRPVAIFIATMAMGILTAGLLFNILL